MVSNHHVDGFSLAVTSTESVYRSLADRFTKRIAKAFQLVLDTAECGSASLDVQDHVDVSGGAIYLHSRVSGMELHHQSADQRPLGVRDGLHDLRVKQSAEGLDRRPLTGPVLPHFFDVKTRAGVEVFGGPRIAAVVVGRSRRTLITL